MAVGKVLILEDEEILGNLYKKKLESVGYEVKLVETVEAAKKTLEKFEPDVVLVDHGIRGDDKTGLDLIKYAKKELPDSKIVMLSNYSHGDLKEEVINAGANDFWIKLNTPPRVLIERVDQLME